MRFVSAQLIALLEGDLWLRMRAHANAMAARLRAALDGRHRGRIDCPDSASRSRPSRTASSRSCRRRRRPGARKLPLLRLGSPRGARCAGCAAFDTTEADIDAFVAGMREELTRSTS